MATYVNDLRLKEIATGDESGTWGTSTNTNLELIAEAFSYSSVATFDSDADKTETIADGSTDPYRSIYVKVTSGVSLTATRTLTIAPNSVSKIFMIENATSGSQSIAISQGSGANVTIPNGDVKVIYTDGAGAGAAVVDAFANLKVTDAAQTNITSVGALDGGSITSGFGSIDVGSSAITTTGTVTGNTLAGTLSTAAQTNITSVGTLSSLTVSGDLTVDTNTLFVDASADSVGIGTTSPSHKLDVVAGSGDNFPVEFNGDSGVSGFLYSDSGGAGMFNGSAVAGSEGIYLQSTTGFASFYTNGSERMRIDASGRLGIGTTSPADKLDIVGTGAETGLSIASGGNGGVNLFEVTFSGGTRGSSFVIDDNENVGIATSSPSNARTVIKTAGTNATNEVALALNHGDASLTANQTVQLNFGQGDNGATALAQIGGLYEGTNFDGALLFSTNTGASGNLTERMRIDSSGRFAMGNTPSISTNYILSIDSDASGQAAGIHFTHGTKNLYLGYVATTATDNAEMWNAANGYLRFGTNNQERMRIISSGNVGIANTTPSEKLAVQGGIQSAASGNFSSGNTGLFLDWSGSESRIQSAAWGSAFKPLQIKSERIEFLTGSGSAVERMRLNSSGLLTIKSSGHASGGGQLALQPQDASDADDEDYGFISFRNNGETTLAQIKAISEGTGNNKSHLEFSTSDGSLGMRMRIRDNGTVQVIGALSKGSGSFEIEHPLATKRETHLLRHSFVEAPTCDNIYRGKVTLVNGSASVNLDEASGMSEGTFVLLNKNNQVFTTNESDWDNVKGIITGNTLNISCQNSNSTAEISWLVIGERHDDNIKTSPFTDSDGKLIVEPEKYENDT